MTACIVNIYHINREFFSSFFLSSSFCRSGDNKTRQVAVFGSKTLGIMKKMKKREKNHIWKVRGTHASGDASTRPIALTNKATTPNTHLTQCLVAGDANKVCLWARAINYESKNNHVQSMVVYHLSTAAATAEAILVTYHMCLCSCICRHIQSPEKICVGNLFYY